MTSDEPDVVLNQQYIKTLHFSYMPIPNLWVISSTGTPFLNIEFKGVRRNFYKVVSI